MVVQLLCPCRQAALAAHPTLVRRLARAEAYGKGEDGDPDWLPAGISPWYLDENGVLVWREVLGDTLDPNWMNQLSVTKADLHRSAILIQRLVISRPTLSIPPPNVGW